mgnify:CR=1 FL=1
MISIQAITPSNNENWLDCGISPKIPRSSIRSITVLLTFVRSLKSSFDRNFPCLAASTTARQLYPPFRQYSSMRASVCRQWSENDLPWHGKDRLAWTPDSCIHFLYNTHIFDRILFFLWRCIALFAKFCKIESNLSRPIHIVSYEKAVARILKNAA